MGQHSLGSAIGIYIYINMRTNVCHVSSAVQTSHNLNGTREQNAKKRVSHACKCKNQILRVLACVI